MPDLTMHHLCLDPPGAGSPRTEKARKKKKIQRSHQRCAPGGASERGRPTEAMEDRAEVDPATTRAPQTKRWARGHDKENFDPLTTSSVTVTAQGRVLRTPPPASAVSVDELPQRSPLADITPPRGGLMDKDKPDDGKDSFSFPALREVSYPSSRGIVRASQLR